MPETYPGNPLLAIIEELCPHRVTDLRQSRMLWRDDDPVWLQWLTGNSHAHAGASISVRLTMMQDRWI